MVRISKETKNSIASHANKTSESVNRSGSAIKSETRSNPWSVDESRMVSRGSDAPLDSFKKQEQQKRRSDKIHKIISSLAGLAIMGGVVGGAIAVHQALSNPEAQNTSYSPDDNTNIPHRTVGENESDKNGEDLETWPSNINGIGFNNLSAGQKVGTLTTPWGTEVEIVQGYSDSNGQQDPTGDSGEGAESLMDQDTATHTAFSNSPALGAPGANMAQDHGGYVDANKGFSMVSSGENLVGKTASFKSNDGETTLVYRVADQFSAVSSYNGNDEPTIVENNPGSIGIKYASSDPNSVIPVEGASLLTKDGQLAADPYNPDAPANESVIYLSTCYRSDTTEHKYDNNEGARALVRLELVQVVENGKTVAGNGTDPIQGYTPEQLQSIETANKAAEIANAATDK